MHAIRYLFIAYETNFWSKHTLIIDKTRFVSHKFENYSDRVTFSVIWSFIPFNLSKTIPPDDFVRLMAGEYVAK